MLILKYEKNGGYEYFSWKMEFNNILLTFINTY